MYYFVYFLISFRSYFNFLIIVMIIINADIVYYFIIIINSYLSLAINYLMNLNVLIIIFHH